MRRIAIAALLIAALAGTYSACSSDAPTPTPPTGGNPKPGASPLLITLFTTNANPAAGSCTLIQAIVTFNGIAVADGTGVSFSTDLAGSFFFENSQPVVSVVTQKGSAIATLCSTSTGTAFVNATATFSGVTAKADPLKIVFQSAAAPAPFFSNCSPNSGPNTGGTVLTINGGRFPGTAATTRATFTSAGVTREALVNTLSPTAVTLTTPAFPEAVSSSTPVTITLTFSGGITLSVPNCFAFGTAATGTPTITAMLPSSGNKDGGTRVSIIGSGFAAPLQVFFQTGTTRVEVQVVSVSFNQIVILTPPSFQFASVPPPINIALDVVVHEVTSGVEALLTGGWRYTLPLVITAISPLEMRADQITPLTIFGHGFQAPVLVTIGGVRALVQSVSDSEILVVPVLASACAGGGGTVTVYEINTGELASSPQSLTITAVAVSISGINPATGPPGTAVTITGTNLPTTATLARVLFGTKTATIVSASSDGTSLVVTAPPGTVTTPPVCPPGTPTGTLLPTGESVTVSVLNTSTGCQASGPAFAYQLPCGVADLALSKSGPASVSVGGSVTYTLTVSNSGGAAAANVTLTDTLPALTTFVSCTPSQGTCSGGATVTAAMGTIPAGGAATLTIQITVQGVPRTMTNNATVTTTTTEPNLTNNSASFSTTVTP